MPEPAVALSTEFVLTLTAVAAIGTRPDNQDASEAEVMRHLEHTADHHQLVTLTIRSTRGGAYILDDPLMHLDHQQVISCFAGAIARASALAAKAEGEF